MVQGVQKKPVFVTNANMVASKTFDSAILAGKQKPSKPASDAIKKMCVTSFKYTSEAEGTFDNKAKKWIPTIKDGEVSILTHGTVGVEVSTNGCRVDSKPDMKSKVHLELVGRASSDKKTGINVNKTGDGFVYQDFLIRNKVSVAKDLNGKFLRNVEGNYATIENGNFNIIQNRMSISSPEVIFKMFKHDCTIDGNKKSGNIYNIDTSTGGSE
jgi:hypothetical protein